MTTRHIALACGDYDRTHALVTGAVSAAGLEINFLPMRPEEAFFRMGRYLEFDAAEMSLSAYCAAVARGDHSLVALPVFPSRIFRHSSIYLSTRSGIAEPADLGSRRVGVPEYHHTALVWIRGMLADEYGVAPESVEYVQGGLEDPGREERLALTLPDAIRLSRAPAGATLSRLLAAGEIDALYSARAPSTMASEPTAVRRLFEDYVVVEKDYWKRTGVFPIMHVVVIRQELHEAAPFAARSLFEAFLEAKRAAYADLAFTGALQTMLPWQLAAVEQARDLGGTDWWPYGLEENRTTLEVFLRYHHEQGLSARLLSPDELFAPSTLEHFRV